MASRRALTTLLTRTTFLRNSSPTILSRLLPPTSPHIQTQTRPRTSGSGYSPLDDPSPNWTNRPPKETILLDGCDYEHWLIVMEFPDNPKPSNDEMVDIYVKTLAQVLGSEEEAKKKIYSVSTTTYTGFGALISEELSYKVKALPGVLWVLPDSYLDVPNKDYGGDLFIDGEVIRRPQFDYSDRQQNTRTRSRPRNDRRRERVQNVTRASIQTQQQTSVQDNAQHMHQPSAMNAPNVTGNLNSEAGIDGFSEGEDLKNGVDLETYYRTMAEENPSNPLYLKKYAQFLFESKGDLQGAEELYSRALLVNPKDGETLLQYATLLWELYHDQKRTLSYMEQAIEAAPEDSNILAAYARFLWIMDDDES